MRTPIPSFAALRAFDAAARLMNFTRAAEDLAVTQSGISQQIKGLETYLNTILFERSGSRLTLTDSGRAYAEKVAMAMDILNEATASAIAGSTEHKSLLIRSTPTFAQCWLASRLDEYCAQNSDSPVELKFLSDNEEFGNSMTDLAILRGHGVWPGAHSFKLFAERLVVVASPKLIPKGKTVTPEQLASYQLLQHSDRALLWPYWFKKMGVSNDVQAKGARFASTAMLMNAVKSGMGVGLVPDVMCEKSERAGEAYRLRDEIVESGESYFAVIPERKFHDLRIKRLRDWLLNTTRYLR